MRGIRSSSFVSVLVLGVVACVSAVACASASGEVKGGELRPGFDPNAPPPAIEQPAVPRDAGSGTAWKDLYRDFFGPTGIATCSLSGSCHGMAGQGGPQASNFICGADINECYRTLRTGKHPGEKMSLVEDSAVANPDSAFLFRVVRLQNADGTVVQNLAMPLSPTSFAFSAADIDRMKTWIRNGAKND